jgi:creatinine amidohydrolase
VPEYRLWKLTWEEAADRAKAGAVVLLPLGTTEQHGRHLPLDTDAYIAEHLCERIALEAQKRGVTVLVAPVLSYGVSWYHRHFAGTMWLSPELFIQTVIELCKSLSHHGFTRKVLVNCHGGNAATLTVAINRFYDETGERVLLAQWWELGGDLIKEMMTSGVIHAEEAETSLALALGQRALMDKASRDAFERSNAVREHGHPWSRHAKYDAMFKGGFVNPPMDKIEEISESGVVGDATRANAEEGRRILETVVTRLVEVCEDLTKRV